jgi:hypothetical protein
MTIVASRHRYLPAVCHRPVRRAGLLLTTVVAALLTGCADRPSAVGFLPSAQPSLQSAGHWQVVATDVASAVSSWLEKQSGKKDPVMVYMERDPATLFATTFIGAMQTELVSRGHPVAVDNRPDVVSVAIDLSIVPHQPGSRSASTVPGPATALGAGVAVAAWMLDSFPWGVTSTALGLTLDGAMTKPGETDTEMVLTVSMVRDGFFTFRSSAVYYVNGRDLWHYADGGGRQTAGSLNDVPITAIAYDIAGKPYLMDTGRRKR